MTPKEIRAMDTPQIAEQLKKARAKMFDLRHKVSTSQVEDLSQLQKLRRDIARMNTICREKYAKEGAK